MFGGAFGYRDLRSLVVSGIPGGPGPVPEEEVPDEERELEELEAEELTETELDVDDEELEFDDEPFGDEPKYRATPKAADMLRVVFSLRRWLEHRPGPTVEPTRDPEAGPAIVALVCGWSSTVMHALAAEPRTLAELCRKIRTLDAETVAETLGEMRRSGLVAAIPGNGQTRHKLTEWGREGIGPLIAAVRYERLHPAAIALPPDELDVEAAFHMALPLLSLPPQLRGRCRLGVWIPGGVRSMAGATIEVGDGRVLSSTPRLDENPDTWITGLPLPWCEAAIEPELVAKLKSGGDTALIMALLHALHERLFGNGFEPAQPPKTW